MTTEEMPTAPVSEAFHLKRILVPVDFSPASNNAAEYARQVSRFTGADLLFLHVVVPAAPMGFDALPVTGGDQLKENARQNLSGLVQTARRGGNKRASAITRTGLPTHEIVEEARESDVDLIVIATHGYTGWKHFCIGSTAERVVRAAPCPVLVVREKEHEFC